ncbi:MAG: hypothetical protein ACYCVL_15460 [Gemmatimonadaceae bacterium]
MPNPPTPGLALALACAAACAVGAAGCRRQPPPPPAEVGVHVANAANDSTRAKFFVAIKGSLQLGIRSMIMGMRPDSSLVLAAPADLVVNAGNGSALITAADPGVILRITPLDRADSAQATVTGRAVRIERQGNARHVTAVPVADTLTPREDMR